MMEDEQIQIQENATETPEDLNIIGQKISKSSKLQNDPDSMIVNNLQVLFLWVITIFLIMIILFYNKECNDYIDSTIDNFLALKK